MKKLLSALLLLTSVNANAYKCNSLSELNWLLGDWKTQVKQNLATELSANEPLTTELLTTESWLKLSDKTFEGVGKTANNTESLRLLEMSDEIFYLAKVSHNPSPVAFKLTACKSNAFVFENEQHDFPNTIEYTLINSTAMQVKVSDNSEKSFTIQLYRVKDNINDLKQ